MIIVFIVFMLMALLAFILLNSSRRYWMPRSELAQGVEFIIRDWTEEADMLPNARLPPRSFHIYFSNDNYPFVHKIDYSHGEHPVKIAPHTYEQQLVHKFEINDSYGRDDVVHKDLCPAIVQMIHGLRMDKKINE